MSNTGMLGNNIFPGKKPCDSWRKKEERGTGKEKEEQLSFPFLKQLAEAKNTD